MKLSHIFGLSLVAGAVASANIASAAVYFLEAENFVSSSGINVYDENSGGLGGEPFSGDEYVQLIAPSGYTHFHIPEGALPAGTYNIADRGFSATATRELDLYVAPGLIGPTDPGFVFVGTVANENNSIGGVEWESLYNATTGSTLATITIPASGGVTLRYDAEGSSPGNSDVFAFLTLGEPLPSNIVPGGESYSPQIQVPEPSTMGMIGIAIAALLARRRA